MFGAFVILMTFPLLQSKMDAFPLETHSFIHEGILRHHLTQNDYERKKALSAERERVIASVEGPLPATPEVASARTNPRIVHSHGLLPLARRRRQTSSEEAEQEYHWTGQGIGSITLRNPPPDFLQRFGNGLNELTRSMADKIGAFKKPKQGEENEVSDTVGDIVETTAKTVATSASSLLDNLSRVGNSIRNYVNNGLSTKPADWDEKARAFCSHNPESDKCKNGRLPMWNDVREMIQQLDDKIRENLPAIPSIHLLDSLLRVPEQLKDALDKLKTNIAHISQSIRDKIIIVCNTRLNCKAQSEKMMQMKNKLKEKLLAFRHRLRGSEGEAALDEQFERTQQVKKALLVQADIDKEVEPADDGVFDSDLLLTTRQAELLLNEIDQAYSAAVDRGRTKTRRAAVFFEDQFFQKWSVNEPIPYFLDESLAIYDRTDIRDALAEISSKTCIRFSEKTTRPTGYHIHYVKIDRRSFCGLSYIGRTAPANPIYLSFDCGDAKGVAMHETLHALGLAHEHVRVDRDEHLKVDWSNINPQYYDAFAVVDPRVFSSYGVQYDYGSIMHYRSDTAAINPFRPTMIPKSNEKVNLALLGQRRKLSKNDIELLNRIYCKADDCVDRNVYCGAWAVQGACTRKENDIWMRDNCRRSCGLC